MKKIQNLKIRPNYKAFALALLLGLVGCRGYKHKNVVIEQDSRWVRLRDVETDRERIYTTTLGNDMRTVMMRDKVVPYFKVGDTITVGSPESVYQDREILTPKNVELYFDKDEIQRRREDEIMWQQIMAEWGKMCNKAAEQSKQ